MNTVNRQERERADLALRIEALRAKGKSFGEIARQLLTRERPLTANAAVGIYSRLEVQRDDDARDLLICDALKRGREPPSRIAAVFGVRVSHVLDLKREALS